jgi:hypothetical protein
LSAEIHVKVLPIKTEVLLKENNKLSLLLSGTQAGRAVLENLNINSTNLAGDVDRHN